MRHWSSAAADPTQVLDWLHWHIVLDASIYVIAYCTLLWFAVRAVDYSAKTAWLLALVVAIVDEAET